MVIDNLGALPEGLERPNLDNFQLYKPGISPDSPFGYKGRMMIMEQLMVTERVQKFIRGEVSDVNHRYRNHRS